MARRTPAAQLEADPLAGVVTVELPANAAALLGFGELIDVAELLDTDLDTLQQILRDKTPATRNRKLRAMVAIAYVWHRRTHPDATWAEAQTWKIAGEVGAAAADPTLSGAPVP